MSLNGFLNSALLVQEDFARLEEEDFAFLAVVDLALGQTPFALTPDASLGETCFSLPFILQRHSII